MDRIQQEFSRLAESVNGTVGACAHHLESGRRVEWNAGVRFPMASAFKVPIAACTLTRVDRGELALDQMIEVQQSDLCPGSGAIRSLLSQPGLILSLRNLLELCLVISDNTAADVLLRLVGGPAAVTQFLHTHGIAGMRADRFTKMMVADRYDLPGLSSLESWSYEKYSTQFDQMTLEKAKAAAALFAGDERDTMTPAAMVGLLTKVFSGGVLAPTSRDVLLSTMQRCQTGEGALKGMLPPGVVVAHKTGTLADVVANDAGIIYLPDGAGHLVVAVCVRSPDAKGEPSSACQRVIANIGRAVYDYFLFG